MPDETRNALDDLLDALVAEYSDRLTAGERPRVGDYLQRVPAEARPGLERCFKMIDAGLSRVPSATRPLVPGTPLGRFELKRELGRGGMAVVWLAHDPELQRAVALKILRPGLAMEERHVDRFKREALAVAKLKHPNIVQIFEVGEAHGYHYLAMEFVEGPSLATVIEALPPKRPWSSDALAKAAGIHRLGDRLLSFEQAACRLLEPVVDALRVAHEAGLVHRDVKPSNILLHRDGRAVIADFGLAKGDGDPALSITGDTLGTPYYMSPEQAWLSEIRVDHRTDVYSMGVTLYELLCGARPFRGDTVLEVFEAIKTQVPAPLRHRAPRASRDAEAVVLTAMARNPEDRYESAEAMARDLRAIAEGRQTEARKLAGGAWRRSFQRLRMLQTGMAYEYRSARTFMGWPLVHIVSGRRMPGQPMRVARGWLAVGDIALGGIAMGGLCAGGVAFGGMAFSLLFTWAGVALGLGAAFGGIAIGSIPIGGIAIGLLAFGGVAFGYAAIGGVAMGQFTAGGKALGTYGLSNLRHDPEAVEFFNTVLPAISEYYQRLSGG